MPLDRVWFFGLAFLNRVCNFTRLCPKKGQNPEQVHPVSRLALKSHTRAMKSELASKPISVNKRVCISIVSSPKQGLKIDGVILHRVGFLKYFCLNQGQDFS